MNIHPHVAIIMSVYVNDNLEQLKLAVDSILGQDYQSLRFFIYKDGLISEEATNYLNEVSENTNIFLFGNRVNFGLANSLNYLIDVVLRDMPQVEFIARMDSDDISHSNRISKQVKYFQKSPLVSVCGTACREFGSDAANEFNQVHQKHDDILKLSISKCPMIHPTVMFRKSVFTRGFRYPTETRFTEDVALWFELLSAGLVFGNIDEPLLDYRLTDDTIRRRLGFRKAISEFTLRIRFMFKLGQFSPKNTVLVFARLVFHLLPFKLVRYLYKNSREALK
ncbi:glycosyltransferase [Paraglaciecola chathamensis]|uniref:Glycosyl transferase n=1 Tax=Paraglaciecola chathamensis TaxID=368405 RepID=A0A8H9IB87_9ALTE|nr:glycosyltransferase [Paraglaciecola oceanifecundans]AEE22086.1 glycosyl transferase family 2 [Glaciecola sp. 4H-3-7+YE-5]GGZ57438.1 glycosyl transferase [Paraglaciecola oceanifecundans]